MPGKTVRYCPRNCETSLESGEVVVNGPRYSSRKTFACTRVPVAPQDYLLLEVAPNGANRVPAVTVPARDVTI
jgi:ribosomal protein L6P/L9E